MLWYSWCVRARVNDCTTPIPVPEFYIFRTSAIARPKGKGKDRQIIFFFATGCVCFSKFMEMVKQVENLENRVHSVSQYRVPHSCVQWQVADDKLVNVFPSISITREASPPCQDGLTLIIGYHELHGKEVPLKSPLVVLRMQTAADKGGDTVQPQQQSHDTSDADQPSLLYVVEGVIRRKYIFKSRPKALISSKSMWPVSKFLDPFYKACADVIIHGL